MYKIIIILLIYLVVFGIKTTTTIGDMGQSEQQPNENFRHIQYSSYNSIKEITYNPEGIVIVINLGRKASPWPDGLFITEGPKILQNPLDRIMTIYLPEINESSIIDEDGTILKILYSIVDENNFGSELIDPAFMPNEITNSINNFKLKIQDDKIDTIELGLLPASEISLFIDIDCFPEDIQDSLKNQSSFLGIRFAGNIYFANYQE